MISKLATQVKASKLTDYQLTNKTFRTGRSSEIAATIGCANIWDK